MNATSTKHNRPYNPLGPVAYFISFRAYGTWLHGDKRGSMDRKSVNVPGTPMLEVSQYRQRWEQRQMKHPAVCFSSKQRAVIDHTIRRMIEHNKWLLHALSVQRGHVHVVLTALTLKQPETVMNSLKSWCTRRLREARLISPDVKPWSRHGSTRWLWSEGELREACAYVTRRVKK